MGDLVFQGGYRERAAIRLPDAEMAAHDTLPVSCMQVLDLTIKIRLIVISHQAINARGGLSLECEECCP